MKKILVSMVLVLGCVGANASNSVPTYNEFVQLITNDCRQNRTFDCEKSARDAQQGKKLSAYEMFYMYYLMKTYINTGNASERQKLDRAMVEFINSKAH